MYLKNKLIGVIMLFVMMGVMTEVVTADTSHIVGTVLLDGIPYTGGDATVQAYSDEARTILISTTTPNSSGIFSLDIAYISHVWLKGTAPGLEGYADGNPLSGAPGINLFLVDLTLIPEFPPVALSIAAVIGFVFIYHQRKLKKEIKEP